MNIKKLRKQLGLTQIQFAELLGTTQTKISTWEDGNCPAYIDKIAEMALLNVGAEKLWKDLENFPIDEKVL